MGQHKDIITLAPLAGFCRQPSSLEAIISGIYRSLAWRLVAISPSDAFTGALAETADEAVLAVTSVSYPPRRVSFRCRKVGEDSFFLESVEVLPDRAPAGAEELWALYPAAPDSGYRAVTWPGDDGVPQYAVEQLEEGARRAGRRSWRFADEWDPRCRPNNVGGLLDCLLYIQQRGKLDLRQLPVEERGRDL